MPVSYSRPRGVVVLRDTAASGNSNYVVVGNTSTSNVAASQETVIDANITEAYWSTDGVIKVNRGANNKFNLTGTGSWNLTGGGIAIIEDGAAAINVSFSSSNGTLILVMTKNSFVTTE